MSVMAPEELEVVSLEGFEDIEIPCEIPSFNQEVGCDGPNPAEWVAYRTIPCSCGIFVRLVCTDCKVRYQNMMAHNAALYCPRCGDETKGFNRFEPLVKS